MRLGGGMGSPCVECGEACVRGVNVYTDDGERETLISGSCERCFDALFEDDEDSAEFGPFPGGVVALGGIVVPHSDASTIALIGDLVDSDPFLSAAVADRVEAITSEPVVECSICGLAVPRDALDQLCLRLHVEPVYPLSDFLDAVQAYGFGFYATKNLYREIPLATERLREIAALALRFAASALEESGEANTADAALLLKQIAGEYTP